MKNEKIAAIIAAPSAPTIITFLSKNLHLLYRAFSMVEKFFKILRWKGGGRKPPFSAGQMGLGGGFYFTSVKTFIEFI